VATHVVAQQLKRRFNVRWIADFRDPLLGNPFRGSKRAALYYWYKEREILKNADVVIANTPPFAEVLRARHPGWAAKIVCIPNGYDPGEVLEPAPIPVRPYRVLAHFGTLYGGRHPERLLSSMDRSIARGVLDPSSIRVELIGRIDPLNISIEEPPFTTLRERGCLFYDGIQVPREQARRQMSEADYLLLLDVNEKELSFQVPAKLYDYLQVGRPILAFTNAGSPTAEILALSGVHHTCIHTTDSTEQIDSAVQHFFRLATEPVNCSHAFRQQYDVSLQTQRLAGILDQLQKTNADVCVP
jgi:glycosyltransferase involved in cell wall biosynthesis